MNNWLIFSRDEDPKTLTLYSETWGETLPLFSSMEDAREFLRTLGVFANDFEVRAMVAEELSSLLTGRLSKVEKVSLDPSAESDADALLGLISVDRKYFVQGLLREVQPLRTQDHRSALARHPRCLPR